MIPSSEKKYGMLVAPSRCALFTLIREKTKADMKYFYSSFGASIPDFDVMISDSEIIEETHSSALADRTCMIVQKEANCILKLFKSLMSDSFSGILKDKVIPSSIIYVILALSSLFHRNWLPQDIDDDIVENLFLLLGCQLSSASDIVTVLTVSPWSNKQDILQNLVLLLTDVVKSSRNPLQKLLINSLRVNNSLVSRPMECTILQHLIEHACPMLMKEGKVANDYNKQFVDFIPVEKDEPLITIMRRNAVSAVIMRLILGDESVQKVCTGDGEPLSGGPSMAQEELKEKNIIPGENNRGDIIANLLSSIFRFGDIHCARVIPVSELEQFLVCAKSLFAMSCKGGNADAEKAEISFPYCPKGHITEKYISRPQGYTGNVSCDCCRKKKLLNETCFFHCVKCGKFDVCIKCSEATDYRGIAFNSSYSRSFLPKVLKKCKNNHTMILCNSLPSTYGYSKSLTVTCDACNKKKLEKQFPFAHCSLCR